MQLYNALRMMMTTKACTIPVTESLQEVLTQKPVRLQADNTYCNSTFWSLYNLGSSDKYRCNVDLNALLSSGRE
ncbi:unnamed protein product [Hydatigera taeniaeformis]|uniref:Uncharacterized protein n=1 Tax=Hydatigena taeniaeformis TaxID=6205 RepID=A0A0R3X1F9_HYDTA|nr:unnamed protein product [Hydatigera taeniaeformis]